MRKYRLSSLFVVACVSLLVASCALFGGSKEDEDGDLLPPVVTATSAGSGDGSGVGPGTPTPEPSTTPTATPTQHPVFPTPVVLETFVAEQEFEHGWAFAVAERAEVWVLVFEDTRGGSWTIYEDEFHLEEQRTGQQLAFEIEDTPPEDKVAPVRGFGWLWANNEEVRKGLGWGVWIELGRDTIVRYDAGGTVNASGQYVQRPGRYTLVNIGGDVFILDEATETFTWTPVSPG